MQSPEYERVSVPEHSAEWKRIRQKLQRSLTSANLTGLERVQNRHTWEKFYQHCMPEHARGHIDFTQPECLIKELWHASLAIDVICESKIGCDRRCISVKK